MFLKADGAEPTLEQGGKKLNKNLPETRSRATRAFLFIAPCCKRGDFITVDNISFSVQKEEIFAF